MSLFIDQVGINPASAATAQEDVSDIGGTYAWPAAALATTIKSDSGNDKTDGTGALTVRVFGLDVNYAEVEEDVIMDGTDAVSLEEEFLRVYQVQVLTAGAVTTNIGTIQVLHSGSIAVCQINPGLGRALTTCYTIPALVGPAIISHARLRSIHGSIIEQAAATADIILLVREFGGAWQIRYKFGLTSTGTNVFERVLVVPLVIPAKADIRIAAYVTGAESEISAGMTFELVNDQYFA